MRKKKNDKKSPAQEVQEVAYPLPVKLDAPTMEVVVRTGDSLTDLLKADASQWVKDQFKEHVPELLPALLNGWKIGAAAGNPQVLRQMAEAMGILASPGGNAPVITNVIHNNNNVVNESQQFSVDSIIRAMSEQKHRKAIDVEIIDVEDLSGKG